MLPSAAWGGIFHVQPTGATGFTQPYRRPTGGGRWWRWAIGCGRGFRVIPRAVKPPSPLEDVIERQGPILLNYATAVELIELPGVGTKTAALIVDFRGKHGPFERVEQLLQIKGIGLRTLKNCVPCSKLSRKRYSALAGGVGHCSDSAKNALLGSMSAGG
jgi:competence ComEA-like helix-hairpin-helix protein